MYWIVCALILIISASSYLFSGKHFALNPYVDALSYIDIKTLALLVFSNVTLLLQDVLMFLGLDTNTGLLYFAKDLASTPASEHVYPFLLIPPAWSISLEIMFYLIAPFLVKRRSALLVMLIVLSLLTRVVLYKCGFSSDPWSYRFFPSELMFFLLGILAYRLYQWLERWVQGRQIAIMASRVVYSLVILAIVAYPYLPNFYKYPLFLLGFFLSLPFIFLLSRSWRLDRYIGELSYPLYISHIFILSLTVRLQLYLGFPETWRGEVCFLLTLLFSLLVNELILKRIEGFRQSRVKSTSV